MNTQSNKPNLLTGAGIGLLLALALMALMFVGFEFAGLPFLPFDGFDWIARTLPGPIITFGIDAMVEVLLALGLGGELDAAAKLSEQLMGLALFAGIGAVLGAGFFAFANRSENKTLRNGTIFGLILAVPFALIVAAAPLEPRSGLLLGIIWVALLWVGFGLILNWIYNELRFIAEYEEKPKTNESGRVVAEPIDRRTFLVRVSGATATLTVVGAGLGALLRDDNEQAAAMPETASAPDEDIALTDGSGNPLPNADAAVRPAPGTRLEYTPVEDHYRIDILSGRLPEIPENYTLPISGLVANAVEWTLDDIREMPAQDAFITMSCISNRIAGSLISTTKWTGVSMQYILDQIQPDENAAALRITGADNFDEYLPLDLIREDERIMLAYAFDDAPLPLRNGFPLRVHIPDRYGMKQPKWITNIEVVDEAGEGYWVRRGWSAEAIVRATSVIDTVAEQAIYDDSDGVARVPIGGMAWAGDRGISKVEVRVDGGEWEEADLRDTMSGRSWTLWRYEWPFSEGQHTFEVRCFEGDGTMQILEDAGVRPDGATGIHDVREMVEDPRPAQEA